MKKKILDICEELCYQKLSAEEELLATKILDSFQIMELICILEETFSITIEAEEIWNMENFSNVNSIEELVRRKMSGDL